MEAKEPQKELEKAEIEIEEMAMQLADMLGAALYFAGVKKEDLPKAIDLYLNGLDEVFEDVVEAIEYIKNKNPKLFHKA